MTRRLIFFALVCLCTAGPAVALAQSAAVAVSGRQLLVQRRMADGSLGPATPYLMRGVNWSPASTNTVTSPTDPENVNRRRPEFAKWHSTDLPLIAGLNANTVRIPMDPGTGLAGVTGRAVLDACHARGIMVAMTIDNGINDTNHIREVVTFYRDHPAVLLWALGNEWNINRYYGAANSVAEAAQRTESAARLVKALDPNHPVASSYGEIDINVEGLRLADTARYVNEICPSVDLWALNIYRGKSFGSLFAQWAGITAKPMFLGEFGIDAFHSTIAVNPNPLGTMNEAEQAEWNVALWQNLARHLSARDPNAVAIGGLVHEFNDQWWKIAPASSQETGGLISATGFPDGMSSEEIFGLCDIFRGPRAAYEALRAAFDDDEPGPGETRLVTTLAGSGPGSLRQAAADAQSGDTIAFASDLRGTVSFGGEIRIAKDVTIRGPGTNVLTLNGNSTTRLFSISNGAAVRISGLALTRGSASEFGGAILNRGFLEVADCLFTSHFAGTSGDGAGHGGAVFNAGTLVVEGCAFVGNRASGNGGAIRSTGELSVRSSYFENNRANYFGGAIYNFASGTVTGSNLTNNSAGPAGGGIWNENSGLTVIDSTLARNSAQEGGGIANKNGSVLLANSTLSLNRGNSGGGGIFNGVFHENGGTLVIANSTIASNTVLAGTSGGGVRIGIGAVTLRSSIVAGNSPDDLAGAIISDGFNFIESGKGATGLSAADQEGVVPRLGELRDNGGLAPTHALAAGSPAIDRGHSFGRAGDQRGEGRWDHPDIANAPGGDGADAGAYEGGLPRFTAAELFDGTMALEFTSVLEGNSIIESRPSLEPAGWTEIATVLGNGGVVRTNVPISAARSFFRIRSSPVGPQRKR